MKEFKNVNEQVELLKSRGLSFKSEYQSKLILIDNNYYNIINGYKDPFIIEDTKDNYINGATFEEIYALYEFDKELRNILLEYILKIENNIKSEIAYYFAQEHGNDNYLKLDNFDNYLNITNISKEKLNTRIKDIQNLIAIINKAIANSMNKDYVKHYMTEYGFIPPWVLVKILTLGQIKNFVELMKQNERIIIAQSFNISEKQLIQYVKLLTYFRNLCAHDDRVYSTVVPRYLYIPDCEIHNELNIPKTNNMYDYGKNDLFALLIVLNNMLISDDFQTLINKLYGRIKNLEKELTSINITKILDKMHFPPNWKDIKWS